MAYLPETKDKTARVSPAAQRVLGPEDPRAREEVEAQKNQEFSTWDQIGVAADMLPGGAIAAGGVKAAAKKGHDFHKMIRDALEGFRRDGDRGAQSAIVNWVSSTDTSIITKAKEYLDSLSGEALKSVEPVRKALDNAYNQFISPKGGHTAQWKDFSTAGAEKGVELNLPQGWKSGVLKRPEGSASPQDIIDTFREALNSGMPDAEAIALASKNFSKNSLERALIEIDKKIASIQGSPAASTLDTPGMKVFIKTQKIVSDTLKRLKGLQGAKPGSALEYVQQQKKIGKDIDASEATKALVPAQDVDSMVLQFEKIAGSKEFAPEAVTDQLIKATEGDVSKLNAMLKKTEILEEEVFRAGGTHPSDLTVRGLNNLVMALHKAISDVTTHLRPSSSRLKSIPPTSGNRLNLPGGPLYGGPPPPQP
jgi:hypothetical protein